MFLIKIQFIILVRPPTVRLLIFRIAGLSLIRSEHEDLAIFLHNLHHSWI